MEFKRIWPKLLIILSIIVIFCFLVIAQKYEYAYYFMFLFSIIASSTIMVWCAQRFKDPSALLMIPLVSQMLVLGLLLLYNWWSPYRPGGAEKLGYFGLISWFFIWVVGGLLAYHLFSTERMHEVVSKGVHTAGGIASLVIGVFGIIFSGMLFFEFLAILSGAVARIEDKDSYGLVGMILGIIGIFLYCLFWIIRWILL